MAATRRWVDRYDRGGKMVSDIDPRYAHHVVEQVFRADQPTQVGARCLKECQRRSSAQ